MKPNLFTQPLLTTSLIAEIEISYKPKQKASDRPKVTTSTDVFSYVQTIFPQIDYREYFYVVCLNRGNHVLGYCQISAGGISGTFVDVRMIMQVALKSNSTSIILTHNHPSGNLIPSDADKEMTRKIRDAARTLDIAVLDHLIVTSESFFSFADEGLI